MIKLGSLCIFYTYEDPPHTGQLYTVAAASSADSDIDLEDYSFFSWSGSLSVHRLPGTETRDPTHHTGSSLKFGKFDKLLAHQTHSNLKMVYKCYDGTVNTEEY